MVTKSEIIEKEEKIKQARNDYEDDKFGIKLYGYASLIGIAGLSYLGLRYIFEGQPDINFLPHYLEPRTFIQKTDDLMIGCVMASALLAPVSIIELLLSIPTKKELRKQESELKMLVEDYEFSRGLD